MRNSGFASQFNDSDDVEFITVDWLNCRSSRGQRIPYTRFVQLSRRAFALLRWPLLFTIAGLLAGQSLLPQQFEVISVTSNRSGSDGSTVNTLPGGRFVATNVSLKRLMESAFGVRDFQVTGGPGWTERDAYDVSAKSAGGTDIEDAELRPLLQAMLVDRFKLKFHREVRQLPVYSLSIAKSGSKMTAHVGPGGPSGGTLVASGRATMRATAAPVSRLAENLSRAVGRTVLDNTGVKGLYDFTLEWAPDQSVESNGPSIFTALQEQLGLKLDATKGPVEVIVIDGAVRASEN
jgi:uncharacterized protein (TIGR03435 family)